MLPARLRSNEAATWAAFTGACIAFVASTVVAQHHSASISDRALSIARKASPSVHHLAGVRGELRQLERTLARANGAPSEDVWERARTLGEGLVSALHQYVELPPYREEAAVHARLRDALASFEDGIGPLAPGPQGLEHLETRVRPALPMLRRATLEALELNAGVARRLGEEIDRVRIDSTRLAFLLDALSVLLTIVAALALVRTRRAHTRALEAQRDELDLFSARVAHDLRTPLSAAALSLDVLARTLPAAQAGTLARARASTDRMRALIDDLLAFARAGGNAPRSVRADPAAVLSQVLCELEPLVARAGVSIELGRPPPTGWLRCSEGGLASVLSNLIRNAIQHTSSVGGRRVWIRSTERKGTVRFEVEDAGPGIPRGSEGKVFEPFFRGPDAPEGGLGLGLATVKRIVEAHGGTVGVTSPPGTGACFWIQLERAEELPRAEGQTWPWSRSSVEAVHDGTRGCSVS